MTSGIRHEDLRRRNRGMVVSAVRRAGQLSRTEIASATALSNSTISAIAADLIAEDVLVEVRSGEAGVLRRGRPQIATALNPDFASVVTAVLTLNHLAVALIAYDGTLIDLEESRVATMDMGPDELAEAVRAGVARVLARRDPARPGPLRMVLAVQGITDDKTSSMLWSPITPHTDIRFGPALSDAFEMPVAVENDCNMIALALKWRTPERYRDDFFAILLSDGIGMGIMLKGALFSGTHSSGAEFGHMIHMPGGALCRCGRLGCVEAYAGNYAVLRAARGLDERSPPVEDIGEEGMRELVAAARAADGPERAAFRRAGEAIGYGLGSLFALFDPAPVALVGHGALAFDILEEPIRQAIAQTAGGQHSGAITFEALPDEAPLIRIGCAMQALAQLDAEIVGMRAPALEQA